MSEQPVQPTTYDSGPFNVAESIVTDPDGTRWLDLRMTLTGQVRVPALGAADRTAQLKAERAILRSMADDITAALDDEENE